MISNEELDELGETKIQHRLDRGDWNDESEIRFVKQWLRKADKERKFLAKCERASVASALHAKQFGLFGIILSLISLVVSIMAFLKE